MNGRSALLVTVSLLATVASSTPSLAHPGSGIAVAPDGQVYFTDTGHGVWRIDLKGRLHSHPGPAFHWLALDPDSAFASAPWPAPLSTETERVGRHPTLVLGGDFPLTFGGDGALYFPRLRGRSLELIRQTPSGERAVHAAFSRAPSTRELRWLDGLTAGPEGSIYFSVGAALGKVDRAGRITAVVERVAVEGCVPLPGTSVELGPVLRDLDAADDGAVYVAAEGCGAVLRVTPAGAVEVVLRAESPWSPTAVAVDGDRLWVLEYWHPVEARDRAEWMPRIRRRSADGTVEIIATVER
ncbi:MAG TPA: hypothetical protein VMV46_22060 [Thermoanaerobaculia bacterium]|nr:hypothetical protein [Thermoanaerobaculia bacterium]